ncbi:QsdR family transcriptional regulator [Umezawaea sp. Da 62-37]|uniref:QsdR family transcriptional regulator n=1 Tax=Umezawaea sp. Da 62-37 TaxID=3075927 RepID=UPI0028F6D307|nr:QsdR family transcriptional regulator [Umezawaea sp. Da 62-37]WNV86317.1 QsdR family transcriptional regulator [Umezawaea sp. Da 62-37]
MDEQDQVTALGRALRGTSCRPTVMDAFTAARRRFAAGERIDMQGLADELGVNRVTLYRWVGSREQLITEVLWAATRKSFDTYRAEPVEGPRTAAALTAFVRDVNEHPGMRQLLRDEPAFALGLLTSTSGEYQQRYLGLIRELIEEDRAAGLVSSEIPLDDLAYTAARITESYIHTRVLIGEQPDARRAEVVLRVLLR